MFSIIKHKQEVKKVSFKFFRTRRLQSEAEARIRAAKAEAEKAAAKARVFEAETQTEDEREPSPPPRPPPPTIVVEEEDVVRPVAPVFLLGLQVRNRFKNCVITILANPGLFSS